MDSALPHRMTGREWAANLGDVIVDPDGWRRDDGVDFDRTPIARDEYKRRVVMCTMMLPRKAGWRMLFG